LFRALRTSGHDRPDVGKTIGFCQDHDHRDWQCPKVLFVPQVLVDRQYDIKKFAAAANSFPFRNPSHFISAAVFTA